MDIYNHKSSVSVICIENSPTVVDHFPMAKWKQTVIAGGIMLAIAIVSAGTVFGVSAAIASAAKLVTIAIGAGIGAIGGTIDTYIYSNDNQDYSQFASWLKRVF